MSGATRQAQTVTLTPNAVERRRLRTINVVRHVRFRIEVSDQLRPPGCERRPAKAAARNEVISLEGRTLRRMEEDHHFHRRVHDFTKSIEHAITAVLLIALGSILPMEFGDLIMN